MNSPHRHRRQFLKNSLATLGSCTFAGPWLALLDRRACAAGGSLEDLAPGYGPLHPCIDQATGLPLLKLPKGFRYTSFGWTGDSMDDARQTPPAHDGMAVLRADADGIWLCRNHEVSGDAAADGPAEAVYDRRAEGGCTNLLFDPKSETLRRSWTSLAGTVRNCAGGPTPWGTWLSCEETVVGPGDLLLGDTEPLAHEKEHGWVFEVPVDGTANPQPLRDMGRFWHEAVAIDVRTGIVYLTEDREQSGLYRFLPNQRDKLAAGGRLEMLKTSGHTDLCKNVATGGLFDVEWVPIDDPYRAHSPGTRDTQGVYHQGKRQQATTFARLEGCFFQEPLIYIVSTSGGDAGCGQVWALDPVQSQLRMVYESPAPEILDMPDNVTISPHGSIVLCENGKGPVQRMRGLTADGRVFEFADNNIQLNGERHGITGDFRPQEWAGVTFSPDGKWMFANIQVPGITFAITGPWGSGLI